MLNYDSPVKQNIKINNLEIKEISPVMKLILRGKKREFLSSIGKLLNVILPSESNTSTIGSNITALWLSPDEWLIHSNNQIDKGNNNYEIENVLTSNISKNNLGAVTDVTDQFVMLNLKGNNVYELFSKGCPFNFNEFKNKKGAVTQTIISKIDVIIHNKDINDINLFVRRSFSDHLWYWLDDGCRFL